MTYLDHFESDVLNSIKEVIIKFVDHLIRIYKNDRFFSKDSNGY